MGAIPPTGGQPQFDPTGKVGESQYQQALSNAESTLEQMLKEAYNGSYVSQEQCNSVITQLQEVLKDPIIGPNATATLEHIISVVKNMDTWSPSSAQNELESMLNQLVNFNLHN